MKPAELPDRLRFVMWLAQLTVGCDARSGSFAEAIGKHENQVSKWLRGESTMAEDSADHIGAVVGIDGLWLRRPDHPKAEEPELFGAWWAKQSAWQEAREQRKGRAAPQLPASKFKPAPTAKPGKKQA